MASHGSFDKNLRIFEALIIGLEGNSSCINVVNDVNKTPLLSMLQKRTFTEEVINLLLKHGGDVNCKDNKGIKSLNRAFEFSQKEEIIKSILEKGVKVDDSPVSSLCLAFQYGASISIIELLLDAGFSTTACTKHGSALHCVVHFPKLRQLKDIVQLLLDRGADVNANFDTTNWGRTVLCSALHNGNEVSVIQQLIDAGASLTSCSYHKSLLLCGTDDLAETAIVKKEVVQLLIQSDPRMDKCFVKGTFLPLKCSVLNRNYEPAAIKLLFDCLNPDDNTLYLQDAMCHFRSDPAVVKILIGFGMRVNGINTSGETALHLALRRICHLNVIKALLECGAEINQESKTGETPLNLAIMHFREPEIMEELLAAGAFIDFCLCRFATELLKPEAFERIKILLRYFFLQNFSFDIECMFEHRRPDYSASLLKFRDECKNELLKMKSKQIGDFSLYEFVSEYSSSRVDSSTRTLQGKKYKFDKLLQSIANNAYPQYFNIISATIGIPTMTIMLKEVPVYTFAYSIDHPFLGKKVFLNYEIMCNIARFSDDVDMLRLILAYYNPHNKLCTGQASNEKITKKRKYIFKCPKLKRPKLQ